jgi:hypothetical protein
MGSFTSGFQELANKLNQAKQKIPIAIDNAILETGYDVVAICKDRSPIDSGTLEKSWNFNEENKQIGNAVDNGNHSIEIFADTQVIATNPNHPDGEYYPPMIENGFDLPNGKHYNGQHMLKIAMTPAKKNLKNNLQEELKGVFDAN